MTEYEEQKARKPKIEELISKHLDGEIKGRAEDFVSFLRENKISPIWGSKNSYNISFKGKRVCIIKVNPNSLDIRLKTQYSDNFNACFFDADEETKSLLLDSVTHCFGCGACKPGVTMMLLSKEVKNACLNPVIRLENPSDKYIELAKQLVLLRMKEIREGNAPRVTYISVKKRGNEQRKQGR